jgi:transporter family protein
MNWLVYSLIALICWGLWGVFVKLASNYLNWTQVFVISGIVSLVTLIIVFFVGRPQIDAHSPGFIYALLAGVTSAVAVVAFYGALDAGKASIVVTLTALYPVVTIIISFLILSERISPLKGVGVALALAAILLLSVD